VFVTARHRGQRLYDWWSRHDRAFDLLYDLAFLGGEQSFRKRSVEALALDAGDSVLELGCGPGNSFAALRDQVGETGRVVGVDYSAGMVGRAKRRVRQEGWENVDVVRGDATTLGIEPGSFDAVYAAMSLTAMPDPDAAIREAFTVLQNGGRIAVLDAQPFQEFPWTVLNSLIVPVSKWTTNWNVDTDVQQVLRETFDSVSISDTNGGTVFVARGLKQRDDSTPTKRE
jgi:phosphatidylethanolamine/phosphatidyl-N-methylethanolamine N-methyltransferase